MFTRSSVIHEQNATSQLVHGQGDWQGAAEGSHIQMVCAFWNDDSHGCGVQVLQDATRVPGVQQAVAEDRICDCADVPATPAAGHDFSELLFLVGACTVESMSACCNHHLTNISSQLTRTRYGDDL